MSASPNISFRKGSPEMGGLSAFNDRCPAWKFEKADKMRRRPSPGEAALWAELRDGQVGWEFYAQFVLYGWIADFFCPDARLVVEVDGGHHLPPHKRRSDARRDQILDKQYGIKTLRVIDTRCLKAMPGVLSEIHRHLNGGRVLPERPKGPLVSSSHVQREKGLGAWRRYGGAWYREGPWPNQHGGAA